MRVVEAPASTDFRALWAGVYVKSVDDDPLCRTPGGNIVPLNGNIKSHVESHTAVIMRREGLMEATLYINKPPCPTINPRSLGCHDALPHMIPEGARLRIIDLEGFDHTYIGLPDPPGATITGL